MKEIIIIKEEIKNDMSQEYQQLLKGLKKSEIIDIISFLESKKVELPEDFRSPGSSLRKETLIDLCISIVKANESSEKWNDILKETPYLDALVVSESEVGEPAEQEEEQNEEEEVSAESDDSDVEGEDFEEDAIFSYEPTLKEQIQWKIYDFKWEMLLLNDSIKSFCTSVDGLFQISFVVELLTLFSFVYKFQNGLTHCPYLVERISNQKLLLFLKYLEIFIGYVAVFIAAPLAVSYYFNFLPEPIEEDDEDDYEEDDDLYASDSEDDEYDSLVAPEDDDSEEDDEKVEEIEEIEENDASEEGEDVNELLLEDGDDYDYEDLDSEDFDDADFEDDYDYEEYPNLTLVDENEKDSFDPFTYSLAKVGIAYIIYRVGTGVCEFNSLAIDSKLYEVSIALGIVGTLISLYN